MGSRTPFASVCDDGKDGKHSIMSPDVVTLSFQGYEECELPCFSPVLFALHCTGKLVACHQHLYELAMYTPQTLG